MEKYSSSFCSRGHISQAQARLLTRFVTLRRRHRKLSRDTKIIKNRHRELCQPYAGKSTKVRKLCWKSNTFFLPKGSPSRTESSLFAASYPQVWNFKKEDTFITPFLFYVITPFLPPGFSRVSARKTRQPYPSRPDPTRARHIK